MSLAFNSKGREMSTSDHNADRATILILEDAAIVRDPIAASLRLAGYKTLCAANGSDGLQLLRHQPPDLVLLDLTMPVVDGITFLQYLRSDPKLAATPVIVLTATEENQARLMLANRGLRVEDCVNKDRFALRVLLDRVALHVARGSNAA